MATAAASDLKVGVTFVSTAGLRAAMTQFLLAIGRSLTAVPGGSRQKKYFCTGQGVKELRFFRSKAL